MLTLKKFNTLFLKFLDFDEVFACRERRQSLLFSWSQTSFLHDSQYNSLFSLLPTKCLCVFDHLIGLAIKSLTWRNLCSKSAIKTPEQRPRTFLQRTCCWFWTGTCPLLNFKVSKLLNCQIFSTTSCSKSTRFITKHLEKHYYVGKIRFLVTLRLLLIAINTQNRRNK